jgi:DNA-binding response OmpR family regulator
MKKKKVMIIDDNKEFTDELKEALDLSGYDVTAVNDTIDVSNIAKRVEPDVILLDLKMPKKSGVQLAYELRQIARLIDVPIIAISAFYKEGTFSLMKVHGITKYLSKPVDLSHLISEIEIALCENKERKH